MLRISKQSVFENYIVFMFFVVLLLSLQFGPDRPLIPYAEFVRLLLVLGLGIIALVLSAGRLRQLSAPQLLAVFFLVAFFIWSLFTAILSGDYITDSVRRVFLAVGTSLVVLVAVFLLKPGGSLAWRLVTIFVAVVTVVSVFGLLISFAGGAYSGSGYGTYFQSLSVGGFQLTHEVHISGGFPRISSVTPNPNTLGFFAGLACLMIAMRYLTGRSSFFVTLILFVLNFAALLHSFSRGSILALFLALVVAAWFYSRRKLILYTLGVAFVLAVASPLYIEPLTAMIDARADKGLQGRDQIWASAMEVFSDQPISGVGFGLEKERIHEPAGIKSTMHNAYFVVLSETGVVGFVFFSAFLLTILATVGLRAVRTLDRQSRAVLMLIFGVVLFVLIRSMVETSIMRFTNVNIIFLLFAAMGLVLANRPKTQKRHS